MNSALDAAISAFAPELPLLIGYSGGADSTALLLACAEKWPGQVRAVHVHHGLQAAADDFAAHCEAMCAVWQLPLRVLRVRAGHATGESPEDAARKARYEAFRALVQEWQAPAAIKSIALAQHADDQVETILLALSRGAGLPGLSAMPASWQRDGLNYHRPLLAVPASTIRVWLAQRGVSFIEDPTNSDERFTRNRIRARLLPVLGDTFAQFRDTFARSARHAAEAQVLLLEMARDDLLVIGDPPPIAALQRLSQPRQANLLRHWLLVSHRATPSSAQLAQLLAQIAACTTRGHQIHLKVAAGHITRVGAHLHYAG